MRSILVNFKNIQEKIEEFFLMVRKNNKAQIKGDKQLEDLSHSVKVMSLKFNEYEKESLEREARIVKLKNKVVPLSTKAEKLEYTTEKMEQYSRRNSILIHGLQR